MRFEKNVSGYQYNERGSNSQLPHYFQSLETSNSLRIETLSVESDI